jgi:hypothetical protein
MATPTYAVGSVVQHPIRQEWGRGLVQAVDQNRLLVQWDGRTEPASWMHLNVVPLLLAEDQTAPVFKRRAAAPRKTPRSAAKSTAHIRRAEDRDTEAPGADAAT